MNYWETSRIPKCAACMHACIPHPNTTTPDNPCPKIVVRVSLLLYIVASTTLTHT
jgi:hypothetical protein